MEEMTRERISALADGELDDEQVDSAFKGLRGAQARADWELYHQIGDVLRSREHAIEFSPAFAQRLQARLDAEPVHIDPAPTRATAIRASRKLWYAAGAAAAVLAFIVTPSGQLEQEPSRIAADSRAAEEALVVTNTPEGMILRDPRIDDYLFAHQRFSPSAQGAAAQAQSATFTSR